MRTLDIEAAEVALRDTSELDELEFKGSRQKLFQLINLRGHLAAALEHIKALEGSVAAEVLKAQSLNRASQDPLDVRSPEWLRHESIDDALHEALTILGE